MKNYAKCLVLLAFISYEIFIYTALDNVAIGYLHDKILEKTVPAFTEFNNMWRALFLIKNGAKKLQATKALLKFVADTRNKLNYEIETHTMTSAQKRAIKIVLGTMKHRASKLSENLLKIKN